MQKELSQPFSYLSETRNAEKGGLHKSPLLGSFMALGTLESQPRAVSVQTSQTVHSRTLLRLSSLLSLEP